MMIVEAIRRWRFVILAVAALGFGALGVAGTQGFIAEQISAEKARLNRANRLVPIVVARQSLAAGTTLRAEQLASREVPARFAPASAIPGEDYESLLGQVLQVEMHAGEPVLQTAVNTPAPGFSDRVRHGIRAMTVQHDEVNSVSGMLRPGDRIDLLFATRSPVAGQAGLDMSRPLMQDLRVLATGREVLERTTFGQTGDEFTSITVEVTPLQAQKLVLAQRSGRLTALLRNPDDRHPIPTEAMDVFSLLGLARPGKPARSSRIEMIVGGQGPLAQTGQDEP